MIVMERRMAGVYFGAAVRHYREKLGISQEELGMRVGRAPSSISKIETGAAVKDIPPLDDFLRWADALEVTPEMLLARMGYLEREEEAARPVELVFTSIADEVRGAEMPADVREPILDGLKHARRLWESQNRHKGR